MIKDSINGMNMVASCWNAWGMAMYDENTHVSTGPLGALETTLLVTARSPPTTWAKIAGHHPTTTSPTSNQQLAIKYDLMTRSHTFNLISFWFVGHVGCHVISTPFSKCQASCVECVWLDAAITKQLVSTRWTMVEVRVDALSEKAVVNLQPVQWCPRRG